MGTTIDSLLYYILSIGSTMPLCFKKSPAIEQG